MDWHENDRTFVYTFVYIIQTPHIVKEFIMKCICYIRSKKVNTQNLLDIFPFTVKMHGFRTIKPEVNVPWQK